VCAAAAAAMLVAAAPALGQSRVAWLELEGELAERPGPFDWLSGDETLTVSSLVRTLDEIGESDQIDAVVMRLRSPAWTPAQIEGVGRAIRELRDGGVRVFAFSDIYEMNTLRLASYADEVILQQGGAVFFPGLYMEEMFLAETLDMVGIEADYVQVGDYKGASEALVNAKPSEEWDENISQLLDTLYAALRAQMRENRNLTDEQLDEAMERAWYADGATAIKTGLIDAEMDRLALTDHLKATLGEDVRFDLSYDPSRGGASLDTQNPFALLRKLSEEPENEATQPSIAIVHIDGAIVDGESQPETAFGGGSVGAVTIREALKEIEDEDLIRGVIVRIDSPGGSAIASENIWQGLRRVAETKPVWVSVGDMAASGGYYIAVAGEKIYLDRSSVVGSIGVVGGKLALGGLYDKLEINVVGRSRGPAAGLFASGPTWTEAQRSLVRDRMRETYDLFTTRVAQGRPEIDLAKTAEGRLFAGEKAIELQMADELGGLHDALANLAAHTGLGDDFGVLHYPGPQSFEDFLDNLTGAFGMQAELPAVRAVRELVGPRAWDAVRDAMTAMTQLRKEPVLLVSPRTLIFR
jgi:protease-4